MADPWYIEIIRAVGPVVGGAIAALVGAWSNHLLHRTNKENERRLFYREKIERLFVLSDNLTKSILDIINTAEVSVKEAHKAADQFSEPIQEMVMIVELYIPELKKDVGEIKKRYVGFSEWLRDYSDQQKDDDPSRQEEFDGSRPNLGESLREFRGKLSVQINEYLF